MIKRLFSVTASTTLLLLSGYFLSACQSPPSTDIIKNVDLTADAPLSTLLPVSDMQAKAIIRKAYLAAGGDVWRRPQSLFMDGYAVFYREGVAVKNDRHRMWRVYDGGKREAHSVDGKVRILSERAGQPIINISYDGQTTYTPSGPQPKSEADKQWSSSFGFGVIRHALDTGYNLERLPDDLIDSQPAFMVRVIDPNGGTTQFGIAQKDFRILKVGFDTNRGWHERIYSNFFTNSGTGFEQAWVQPGRVRLYYDGVKSNEVIWTSFSVNTSLPPCRFVLPEAQNCSG